MCLSPDLYCFTAGYNRYSFSGETGFKDTRERTSKQFDGHIFFQNKNMRIRKSIQDYINHCHSSRSLERELC